MGHAASKAWAVSLASFVALTLSGAPLLMYTQGLFLQPMTSELGWTRAQYFLPLSIAGVVSAILTPFIGRAADRYGIRPILLPGIIVFALSYAGLGLVNGRVAYSSLLFLALVAQIPHGILLYAQAVATWPSERPGLLLGITLAGPQAGGMWVPPVAEWLISNLGWRDTRLVLAAAVIATCLPAAWLFVRSPACAVATIRVENRAASSAHSASKTGTFWLLLAMVALVCIAVIGVMANASPIFLERGFSPTLSALGLSILAATALTARLASGYVLDKSRSAKIGLPWMGAGLLGIVMLMTATTPAVALFSFFCLGIALGSEIDLAAYFVRRYFGTAAYGQLYGTVLAIYAIGATTAPLIFGLVFDKTGSYSSAIGMAGCLLLLSMLSLFLMGPYRFAGSHAGK